MQGRGAASEEPPASVLDAVLDLVTGSSCVVCRRPGRVLCRDWEALLPREASVARPDPCPPGLVPAVVAGPYAGALRAMVLAHKEHTVLALARPLGDALAAAVAGLLGAPGPAVVLVPVPSHPAVVRSRGHDPMLRVARRAALVLRRDGHRVRVARPLRQVRRPRDQAGLDAESRRLNLLGSVGVRPRALERLRAGDPLVVVCDDVLTTGWTAREAQRALEAGGLVVHGIACVAATHRRDRRRAR